MVEEDDEPSGFTPRPQAEEAEGGDVDEERSKKRSRPESDGDASPVGNGDALPGAGKPGNGKFAGKPGYSHSQVSLAAAKPEQKQKPKAKPKPKPKGEGTEGGVDGAAAKPKRSRRPTLAQLEKDLSTADETDVVTRLVAVLQDVRGMTDEETGRVLSALFVDKPDRELYPDYYKMIKQPISLNCIGEKLMEQQQQLQQQQLQQQQLQQALPAVPPKKYLVTSFEKDMKKVWKNAKTYNQEGSLVYVDASVMETQVDQQLKVIKASVKQMQSQTPVVVEGSASSASSATGGGGGEVVDAGGGGKKRTHSALSKEEEKERKRQKKEKKKKTKKKKDPDRDRDRERRQSVGGSDSD
jgi:hypothetical protein